MVVAPHQNASGDAFNILGWVNHQMKFMTRGDLFKTAIARFFLRGFGTIPIYRERDGRDALKKNAEVFDFMNRVFKANGSVIIFPEANCVVRKQLRPLKKGASRMAFAAEKAYDYKLGMILLPAGLSYQNHSRFRSDCLVQVGEPIEMSEYVDAYQEHPAKAINALTKRMKAEIEPLMINLNKDETYDLINFLMESYTVSKMADDGETVKDQMSKFKRDRALISDIEAAYDEHPDRVEALAEKAGEYEKALASHSLEPADTRFLKLENGEPRSTETSNPKLMRVLKMLLLLPLWLFGFVNNIAGYSISRAFVNKVVGPGQFYGSARVGIGGYASFWTYMIQGGALWYFTGLWWLVLPYWVASAYAGFGTLRIWDWWKDIGGRIKASNLKKEDLVALLSLRDEVYTEVDALRENVASIEPSLRTKTESPR